MTAASARRAARAPDSAASVTMALSFGLTRAIAARCASSTSTGLTARARSARRARRPSCASEPRSDESAHHLPDQCTKRRSIVRNSRLSP